MVCFQLLKDFSLHLTFFKPRIDVIICCETSPCFCCYSCGIVGPCGQGLEERRNGFRFSAPARDEFLLQLSRMTLSTSSPLFKGYCALFLVGKATDSWKCVYLCLVLRFGISGTIPLLICTFSWVSSLSDIWLARAPQ
jgi:hypothetical protein